ncbi:MAG: phosphoglucosamine mutase, partial [Clostridia bacterium]|nr:phosphoglucosamine mutase [Clostridia bacterium]
SYRKFKIGLDCANGASWMIAKAVFGALGAQMTIIGNTPNGLNVNKDCGSTHLEKLCELVKEKHLDMGFAFDGDADRCLAVDEHGNVIDGDAMLYILGKRLLRKGTLNGDTLVATIMSNSGLVKSLAELGISCEQTAVGDRFVYEKMQSSDYKLGGEQSGHIILKKYATTGDGILTAIMLLEEVCDTKLSLAELVKDLKLYPQKLKNVKVRDKAETLADADVNVALKQVNDMINGNGRVLLRQSGTEPKIRIMVEAETEELCDKYIDIIAKVIIEKGYQVD